MVSKRMGVDRQPLPSYLFGPFVTFSSFRERIQNFENLVYRISNEYIKKTNMHFAIVFVLEFGYVLIYTHTYNIYILVYAHL
jgi:hypothetical protein